QAALRLQPARAAVHGNPFEVARRILPRRGDLLEVEDKVIGYEQIKSPVAVVIHPRATRAPARALVPQSRRLRHIRERAVAVVPIEHVLPPAGDEDVVETVVVVVADRHSISPALTSESGLLRNVGERAVAI